MPFLPYTHLSSSAYRGSHMPACERRVRLSSSAYRGSHMPACSLTCLSSHREAGRRLSSSRATCMAVPLPLVLSAYMRATIPATISITAARGRGSRGRWLPSIRCRSVWWLCLGAALLAASSARLLVCLLTAAMALLFALLPAACCLLLLPECRAPLLPLASPASPPGMSCDSPPSCLSCLSRACPCSAAICLCSHLPLLPLASPASCLSCLLPLLPLAGEAYECGSDGRCVCLPSRACFHEAGEAAGEACATCLCLCLCL